jgi:copper homeostasis protein CutC
VGLGAYHGAAPILYYVDSSEVPDDAYWYIEQDEKGHFRFRNALTNDYIVYDSERVDAQKKGLNVAAAADDVAAQWSIMSLEEGVDGIVIGALTKDGALDIPTCQKWIAVAREWQKEHADAKELGITFHRAFDVCCNPMQALEEIIAMGCNRLLTSGQQPSAVQGIPMLKQLVEASAGRLCILAGAGVSAENYMQIVNEAGVSEVHGSFKGGVPVRD